MMTNGMEIARQLIAEEREQQTGFLDLGNLGLTELPEELFGLTELRGLNLGDTDAHFHRLVPNALSTIPASFNALQSLETLSLCHNPIHDLGGLQGLAKLRSLDCSFTPLTDFHSLPQLPALRDLSCAVTAICDLSPLAAYNGLTTLVLVNTGITDLSPLRSLIGLQQLDFSSTEVTDLGPLKGLTGLTSLSCNYSHRIRDLSPLDGLSQLIDLSLRNTSVTDLNPLRGLTHLETLDCAMTLITEWRSLQDLRALKTLHVSGTNLSDLELLQPLKALQELECWETEISDLGPIAKLSNLQRLDCDGTLTSDLQPLSALSKLEKLSIQDCPVSDLSPLRGLAALKDLDCSYSGVHDLTPLIELPHLEMLAAEGCLLDDLPHQLVFSKALDELNLHDTTIPGIPPEVLSEKEYGDCLPTLRAHLIDLAAGCAEIRQTKLVVLGNGRVGKTQLCRHLRGLAFDESIPSTHGITVTSERWANGNETLNIWDFGGQDIYHGAHTLFMQTRAIFVIVWHPDFERSAEETADGVVFRNYPLSYWLEYVRTLGRSNSPVIVVQSRCERPEEFVRKLPAEEALLDLPFLRQCAFSTKTGRGKGALKEALEDAMDSLRRLEGITTIGTGRLQVLQTLERWRDEDQAWPVAERQHRTLSRMEFDNLCEQIGGVSSPASLLAYLHNLGVVFHRPELFEDRIILDQSWALDAVYGVFERRAAYPLIASQGGRFTRSLLEMAVWRDYPEADQRLFLSLMASCAIVFEHRKADSRFGLDTEYLAPDLLMDKAAIAHQLAGRWNDDAPTLRLEYDYPFLHPGLMRALICDVGQRSADAGVYWKYGLWVYDAASGCHARLEQQMSDLHRGRIVLQIQGPRHDALARWLRKRIENRNRFFGYPALQPVVDEFKTDEKPSRLGVLSKTMHVSQLQLELGAESDTPGSERRLPDPSFAQLPASFFPAEGPQVFVSYAWGDTTPEGQRREQLVDELCSKLGQQGIKVRRDRDEIRPGELISEFMDRLADGDYVLAVISDKYLKSEYCMYELFRIYRNCADKLDRFQRKVIPLILPDAALDELEDRFARAIHWTGRKKKLKPLVEGNLDAAGLRLFQKYKLIGEFARNTSDMLELLVDKLQPRDFDHQAEQGFTEILAQIHGRV